MDLSQHGALERQSSLVYWWPVVEGLGIPVPRTVVLDFGHELLMEFLEPRPAVRPVLRSVVDAVFGAARSLGYPDRAVFLRTDQASGKHEYEHTCRVGPEGNDEVEACRKLTSHIVRVLEANELAGVMGLPYRAIVVREFLPLAEGFRAFWGGLPIGWERRYFVRDGRVVCHHPYWTEDAIHSPSVPDWRERLHLASHEPEDEVAKLSGYAERVGRELDGYWSVDFARAVDGTWYLIDMARGELSWHPEGCTEVRG